MKFDIIITILFVSFLEQLFFIAMVFVFTQKYHYLEINRKNISRYMTVAVLSGLISYLLKQYLPELNDVMVILGVFTMTALICLIYQARDIKQILTYLMAVILTFTVSLIIQTSYVPLLLWGTKIDVSLLNKPGILLVLLSLPERLLEALIIGYFLFRRSSYTKKSYFKIVINNSTLLLVTITVFVLNILFLAVIVKHIRDGNILADVSYPSQILTMMGILLFPVLNIGSLICAVMTVENRNAKKRFHVQEELKVSLYDIKFFLKRKEYNRILDEIKQLEKDTEEIL